MLFQTTDKWLESWGAKGSFFSKSHMKTEQKACMTTMDGSWFHPTDIF